LGRTNPDSPIIGMPTHTLKTNGGGNLGVFAPGTFYCPFKH
jgi:hypothetical protein